MRTILWPAAIAIVVVACGDSAAPSDWSRVSEDRLERTAFQSMEAVVVGGPGWVAVGWEAVGNDIDAGVWTSADGVTWSQVDDDADVLAGEGGRAMSGVTDGGPGLVAVGWDSSGGDQDGAVWTSADGLTWSQAIHTEDTFGGPGDQWIFGVAAVGSGLVAVGQDTAGGDQDGAVWTSRDGLTWSRVAHDEGVFGGPGGQAIFGVVSGGPGVVAVGWDSSGGEADGAVWTSPDGSTWSRAPHDEETLGGAGDQQLLSLIAGSPDLVAVGWDSSGGDQDAALWTSADGSTWSRIPHDEDVFGGPGDQEATSLAADGSRLVAVGWEEMVGDQDAAVWTSEDGSTWSRVPHDEGVFGGSGQQWMLGVAVSSGQLVAVGWDALGSAADPAVWMTGTR